MKTATKPSRVVESSPGGSATKATLIQAPQGPPKIDFGPIEPIPIDITTKLRATPMEAVRDGLKILGVRPGDTVTDLGCGDARSLIEAMKMGAAGGIGVDINPETVELARKRVKEAGFADKVIIAKGDITERLFAHESATLVFMYLFDPIAADAIKHLPSGCRVLSYNHDIPGHETQTTKCVRGKHTFFLWVKP